MEYLERRVARYSNRYYFCRNKSIVFFHEFLLSSPVPPNQRTLFTFWQDLPPLFERTLEIKLKRRRSSYKFQVSWRMSIADSRRRLEFPETETSCRIRPISNARETRRDVGNLQWNGIKRDVYVKRGLLGRNVYRNDAEISKRISSGGGRRK